MGNWNRVPRSVNVARITFDGERRLVVARQASDLAMVLSVRVRRYFMRRFGGWNGGILATLFFVLLVSFLAYFLPAINQVPTGFPADVQWRFRLAAWALK